MLPENIKNDFKNIVFEIKQAHNKALQSVNTELLTLYWNIGKIISEKIKNSNWGDNVIDSLSEYIKMNEPEIKGFNRRNLYRMREFYETYSNNLKVSTLWTQLSWSHHRHIMSKTKTIEEKEFYMLLAIKEKHSVRELERIIDSGYFERYMLSDTKAIPNISIAKHLKHSEIQQNILDTYSLEFLQLPKTHSEKDLQQAIVENLKKFILEIGRDFSFVGQNYRIQVGNKDFYVDLLFFHRELQCLVVFELKVTEFKPEYISKMDFYLEAIDRQIKKPHENPSVGVILCKDKNDEIVEIALSRSLSPTMIAKYEIELINKDLLRKKLHEFYELEKQTFNNSNTN
jgi:predicted nuclease of restriction endonuclease-like (RecB) superfamily